MTWTIDARLGIKFPKRLKFFSMLENVVVQKSRPCNLGEKFRPLGLICVMAIPDYQSLMLPVLKSATPAETSVPELANVIADEFGLSDTERNQLLPSGKQKLLHNRIHWAKFYLAKAGLIDVPRRGRFITNESGRSMLATRPVRIDVERLLQIPAFRDFHNNEGATRTTPSAGNIDTGELEAVSVTTPEEQIDAASIALHSALRSDLLQRILQKDSSFFEAVIIDLLVGMGYGGSHKNAAEQLGRTGDGGVDGVINEDRLGLDRVYVQAKRYGPGSSVGRPDVQGFVGSLVGLGASKGVFVTTSTFSSQAIEFVRHLTQRIVLIDGLRLADLMIEHNVGVRVARAVEFKRIDEDFFSDED